MSEPKLINEITMTYINKKENSQKYYIAKLVEFTEDKQFGYVAVYGRLDKPIEKIKQDNRKWTNISPKSFSTLSEAESHFKHKYNEKIRKGYTPLLERDCGTYKLAYGCTIADAK